MTQLKQEDQDYLVSMADQPLRKTDLIRLVEIWKRNHSSWTTAKNMSRLFSKSHMPNTMIRLNKIIQELPQNRHDTLGLDVIARIYEEVITYRIESNSSSASSLMSTTNQIIRALMTTSDMFPHVMEPYKLTDNDTMQLHKFHNKFLIMADVQSLINFFTHTAQKFNKPFVDQYLALYKYFEKFNYLLEKYKGASYNEAVPEECFTDVIIFFENNINEHPNIEIVLKALKQSKTYENYQQKPQREEISFSLNKQQDVPEVLDLQPDYSQEAIYDIPNLAGKVLTYQVFEQCAGIVFQQLGAESTLSLIWENLEKRGQPDEQIDHVLRGRLFEYAENHQAEIKANETLTNVMQALFSTMTMRTCITISVNSSDEEIITMLNGMMEAAEKFYANNRNSQWTTVTNIDTFRYMIEGIETLKNKIGDIFVYYSSRGESVSMIHLDKYDDDTQLEKSLRKFVVSTIQSYEKARENDKLASWFRRVNTQKGCIEAAMEDVLTWSALTLSDNRDISLIVLPEFVEVMAEAASKLKDSIDSMHVYQIANRVWKLLKLLDAYKNYPDGLQGKCQYDKDYAPDKVITKENIAKYFLFIGVAECPRFDELLNEECIEKGLKSAIITLANKGGSFDISANLLALKIYQILSEQKETKYQDGNEVKEITEENIKSFLLLRDYQEELDIGLCDFKELVDGLHTSALSGLFGRNEETTFSNVMKSIIAQLEVENISRCNKDPIYAHDGIVLVENIINYLVVKYGYDELDDDSDLQKHDENETPGFFSFKC